jgi:transcriptional regulator GlxA family with amidase domain
MIDPGMPLSDTLDPRIATAVRILQSHPEQEIDIAALAQRVNLSERQFERVFAEQMGITATRFRLKFRLEFARTRLETTFDSVKQVMAASGFKNQSHFSERFKKTYGLAPTEYRDRRSTIAR